MGHSEYDPCAQDRRPWNAGRKIGAKRALKAHPYAIASVAEADVIADPERLPARTGCPIDGSSRKSLQCRVRREAPRHHANSA